MALSQLTKLRDWLAAGSVGFIGDPEFQALRAAFPSIAEDRLRKLLRQSGVALAPLVEGVRQDDFDHLARTLINLQHLYETSDRTTQHRIRAMVIKAKDHARLASIRKPEKVEMVEWMLIWLENPPVFETWRHLRRAF